MELTSEELEDQQTYLTLQEESEQDDTNLENQDETLELTEEEDVH